MYCHISITTIGDPESIYLYAEQCSSLFAERMGLLIGFLHHIGCRPLSRQDLVSWKLALDRHELSGVDKEVYESWCIICEWKDKMVHYNDNHNCEN